MYELPADQLDRVAPLLRGLRHAVPPKGIAAGMCPGRVFVDDPAYPRATFFWTPFSYFYLAREADRMAFLRGLRGLLHDELIPASAALGERSFILYPLEPAWAERLDFLLEGRAPLAIYRRTFNFDPARFAALPPWRSRLPEGFTMRRAGADLFADLGGVPFPIHVFWQSREAFLERGIGFCLMDGETPVSTCFSPFVVDGQAEVDIFTAEAYRRRGLAALTASAFIEEALSRGLTPNWECFWDNTPSDRLARSLGFDHDHDVPVRYWEEPGPPPPAW